MAKLTDVAREAGVSPATVSRHLNGRLILPQTTRDRIDAAIARLGYRPNVLAQRLSTGRSQSIGLVVPDIANPFFAAIAHGAAFLDTAALTGESLPVRLRRGAEAMSGSTNIGEAFDLTATRPAKLRRFAPSTPTPSKESCWPSVVPTTPSVPLCAAIHVRLS